MNNNSISSDKEKGYNEYVIGKVSVYKFFSALFCLICIGIGYPLRAQPIDIGNRRQVFVDSRFIAESKGTELKVHQPQKTGEQNIKPEYPWEMGGIGPYTAVLYLGGTYHMWYHAMASTDWNIDKHGGCICYAKSSDGVHWEKPFLGLTEFAGSKDNNIVFGHGAAGVQLGQDGGMVFVDPNAPEDQKFNLAINDDDRTQGTHVYSSPDGFHWKISHRSVLNYRKEIDQDIVDAQNVIFWDNQTKKYVAYGRRYADGLGRSIFRGEATTIDGFPPVQDMPIILKPDSLDLSFGKIHAVDYYLSCAIKYPWADNAYLMFPTAYFHYIFKVVPEWPQYMPNNAGPLDTQFTSSSDGLNWQRFDRQPFLGLGMKGDFDWASARMIYGMVPSQNGREIYMYYRASDWLHGWDRDDRNKGLMTQVGLGADQNIAVISRVVLRMDGFVSVRGAYTGGQFTTPLLKFSGSNLLLNMNTSATGIVRVEVLDMNGKPLDGYSIDNCDLIHTCNEINRVVSWHGNKDVSSLAGKAVRLRFEIRDADLYAFQFNN